METELIVTTSTTNASLDLKDDLPISLNLRVILFLNDQNKL